MCGIVGYVGKKKALPILLEGIKNLEYRGYDSAGLAIIESSGIFAEKAVGRVSNLESRVKNTSSHGSLGIIHSRWATHGSPTEVNAHPHTDCKSRFFLVHNGIIENYGALKNALISNGHVFVSETDTEVLAHLIEEASHDGRVVLEDAVCKTLLRVKGTYGLAIIDAKDPGKLIAARNFSPLIVGVGRGEYFVASDASAILRHTRRVIYLNDGEVAVLTPKSRRIFNLQKKSVRHHSEKIEWRTEAVQKGGFPHFMLKEIFEEPDALLNSIRGRIDMKRGIAVLGGLTGIKEKLTNIRRIIISGMGTAYLAGLLGKYIIEELTDIPVEAELASEFRHRKYIFQKNEAAVFISQSGETADTLAALQKAKKHELLTLGVVNVVGSTIARETDAGVYQHIGPEVSVASTKAFLSQVIILTLFAIALGRERKTVSAKDARKIFLEMKKLPKAIQSILNMNEAIKEIAKKYAPYRNFLYLGRGYNLPAAHEGALKLKEISYVHAEGMAAGEMKHGPIAMIDEQFPTIFIAPKDSVYEKNISNIKEIKARNGKVLAIATAGDSEIKQIADDVIHIPKAKEFFSPLLAVVALQLFAYHFAVARGCDIDKPRNLAKSVTVE